MADVVHNTQQEYWRPPAIETPVPTAVTSVMPSTAAVCARCETEFMIGSRFCHSCGTRRPDKKFADQAAFVAREYLEQKLAWLQAATANLSEQNFRVPKWLRYLHFHEIKAWIGLPTASFAAFMIGVGCVAGAIGVGLFYKASTMGEFQAVQLWRIEWLLAATASFVAGILLKRPSRDE